MPLEIDDKATNDDHSAARGHFKNEGSDVFKSMDAAEKAVEKKYEKQKDRDLCYILSSTEDELWFVLHGLSASLFDERKKWLKETELVGRINKDNVK